MDSRNCEVCGTSDNNEIQSNFFDHKHHICEPCVKKCHFCLQRKYVRIDDQDILQCPTCFSSVDLCKRCLSGSRRIPKYMICQDCEFAIVIGKCRQCENIVSKKHERVCITSPDYNVAIDNCEDHQPADAGVATKPATAAAANE